MKTIDEGKGAFKWDEIEDVRIYIVANKGKHYGIIPKSDCAKDIAKKIRIIALEVIVESHDIVDTALEDLVLEKRNQHLKH